MEKIAVRKLENIETTQMWMLWFLIFMTIIPAVFGGIFGLLIILKGLFS